MIEPLRLQISLDCGRDHAFATWTERFGRWWPRAHSVSGDPTEIVLEPVLGGRIYERTADGREIDWGEIVVWDPPERLAYWWHIRRDRADATHVEITFVDTGETASRIEIVQSGWERLGADAVTWRDANQAGWNGLVPHFVAACGPIEPRSRTNKEPTP